MNINSIHALPRALEALRDNGHLETAYLQGMRGYRGELQARYINNGHAWEHEVSRQYMSEPIMSMDRRDPQTLTLLEQQLRSAVVSIGGGGSAVKITAVPLRDTPFFEAEAMYSRWQGPPAPAHACDTEHEAVFRGVSDILIALAFR